MIPKSVTVVISKCLNRGDDDKAMEDFTRLITMFIFNTIFYLGSSYAMRVRVLENISDMNILNSLAWVKMIHNLLRKKLQSWMLKKAICNT